MKRPVAGLTPAELEVAELAMARAEMRARVAYHAFSREAERAAVEACRKHEHSRALTVVQHFLPPPIDEMGDTPEPLSDMQKILMAMLAPPEFYGHLAAAIGSYAVKLTTGKRAGLGVPGFLAMVDDIAHALFAKRTIATIEASWRLGGVEGLAALVKDMRLKPVKLRDVGEDP